MNAIDAPLLGRDLLQVFTRSRSAPEGLISLLMIRYKVEKLFALLHRGKELEAQFADKAVVLPTAVLTDDERVELLQLLSDGDPSFLTEIAELEMLLGSETLIGNFYNRVYNPAPNYVLESVRTELRSLWECIEFELDSRLFLFMSREQAKHYKNANVLS